MSVSIIEPAVSGMSGWLGAATSVLGKVGDALFGKSQSDRNRETQEEFAKKGIRWRVADAKAAGLHPLAALGAAGASYSPTSVVSDLGSVGQDIHRAIEATRTADERAMARASQEAELALRTRLGEAQVGLLEAQTHLANSQAHQLNFVGPPMPRGSEWGSSGLGAAAPEEVIRRDLPKEAPPGLWKVKPAEVQSGQPGNPGMLAGPPNPSERLVSFRGREYKVPNVDLDTFLEEPVKSMMIIAAMNPGLTDELIEELWTRGLGLPALHTVGVPHRYWGYRRGRELEHINRVRKGWKSQAPIGH